MLLQTVVFVLLLSPIVVSATPPKCTDATVFLTESAPVDLPTYIYGLTTYDAWINLINSATSSIDIAAFYMTLTDGDEYPSNEGGWMGKAIYNSLIYAKQLRNVTIRIVLNEPSESMPDKDAFSLQQMGVATVKTINWPALFNGYGVMHTKFIVVDNKHFYVGSANFDWRALAQIKELGVTVMNCPPFADDLTKVFEMYWLLATSSSIPPSWPWQLYSGINMTNQVQVQSITGDVMSAFLALSPPPLSNDNGRTHELEAILSVINNANSFVAFSVMDYSPVSFYRKNKLYWPAVDDALRAAAARNVSVMLMFSFWEHTKLSTFQYMYSLDALDNIEVKLLKVPPNKGTPIPFTRVNHSKYIVTDNSVYITTNNCSPDYYLDTAGVSVTFSGDIIVNAARLTFERDWKGPYVQKLPPRN